MIKDHADTCELCSVIVNGRTFVYMEIAVTLHTEVIVALLLLLLHYYCNVDLYLFVSYTILYQCKMKLYKAVNKLHIRPKLYEVVNSVLFVNGVICLF